MKSLSSSLALSLPQSRSVVTPSSSLDEKNNETSSFASSYYEEFYSLEEKKASPKVTSVDKPSPTLSSPDMASPAVPLIMKIEELPIDKLTNYPVNPTGNDPHFNITSNLKTEKHLVFIGTGGLNNLKLALSISTQVNHIPKIYIIDNSRYVHEFWTKLIESLNLYPHSMSEKQFYEIISNFINSIENTELNQYKDSAQKYEMRKLILDLFKSFIQTDKHSIPRILNTIANVTLIRQDWSNSEFFKSLKSFISETYISSEIVTCPSNIAGYIAKGSSKSQKAANQVLFNACFVASKYVLATDLNVTFEEFTIRPCQFITTWPKNLMILSVTSSESDFMNLTNLNLNFPQPPSTIHNPNRPYEKLLMKYDVKYDFTKPTNRAIINAIVNRILQNKLSELDEKYYPYLLFFSKSAFYSAITTGNLKVVEFLIQNIELDNIGYFQYDFLGRNFIDLAIYLKQNIIAERLKAGKHFFRT